MQEQTSDFLINKNRCKIAQLQTNFKDLKSGKIR